MKIATTSNDESCGEGNDYYHNCGDGVSVLLMLLIDDD